MTNCVFCAIVADEAPAYRVHETDTTLAFLDIEPINPGHTLVIPKAHHETLTETPPDLAADTFRATRTVAEAVEAAMDPDGLNLFQSNGEAAFQEVFHVHVHVLPRHHDDGVGLDLPRSELTDEEGREVSAAIREAQ